MLINNAGVDTDRAFIELDHATNRSVLCLNLEAALILTRDATRHMVRWGSGHLVQMSSVAGPVPFPGLTAYGATKAGLINFAESLRVELRFTDIGITVVAPDPTATAMWERIEDATSHFPDPQKRL